MANFQLLMLNAKNAKIPKFYFQGREVDQLPKVNFKPNLRSPFFQGGVNFQLLMVSPNWLKSKKNLQGILLTFF